MSEQPEVLKHFKSGDREEHIASVCRVLGKTAEIDSADVDAIIVAFKGREDANGESQYDLYCVGNAELLHGLIRQSAESLMQNVPGYAEEMMQHILGAALRDDVPDLDD